MSAHHIYLSCPIPDCSTVEQIYTGDVFTESFMDSGPQSFEGEFITIRCIEHIDTEMPLDPNAVARLTTTHTADTLRALIAQAVEDAPKPAFDFITGHMEAESAQAIADEVLAALMKITA